jgi:AcrR family transcriptional regulator
MTKKMTNTRKLLIEVARDLFAKHGKNNVTMNDIAEATKKGRRTLYTYFTNKEEIYHAVIEGELEYVLSSLELVAARTDHPETKLTNHIVTHLDTVKYVVNRNGSLRAYFFRDIYEVERSRRKIDIKEIEMIKNILREGVENKIFKRLDIELSAIIIFYAIKGLEVPYIRQSISEEFERNKDSIVDFILKGIIKKEYVQPAVKRSV